MKIDEKNHHTHLWARIGKASDDGQFDIVWTSQDRIRPDPWVDYLYPNKDCDFTNPTVLERLKKPWSRGKEPLRNDGHLSETRRRCGGDFAARPRSIRRPEQSESSRDRRCRKRSSPRS